MIKYVHSLSIQFENDDGGGRKLHSIATHIAYALKFEMEPILDHIAI